MIAFAPVILTVGLIAAGVAAVILIVEDLIVLFNGGESVIGEFIDTLFGLGSAQAVVEQAKRDWESFLGVLSDVWEVAKGIGEALGVIDAPSAPRGLQPQGSARRPTGAAAAERLGLRGPSGTVVRRNGRAVGGVVNAPTTINQNISGNPSREELARMRRVVDETLERRNQQASDALVEVGL